MRNFKVLVPIPKAVTQLMDMGVIIAGGYPRALATTPLLNLNLIKDRCSDIDVFVQPEDYQKVVESLLLDVKTYTFYKEHEHFTSFGINTDYEYYGACSREHSSREGLEAIAESIVPRKIQIINSNLRNEYETPEQLVEQFDFTCCGFWLSEGSEPGDLVVKCSDKSFDHEYRKILYFNPKRSQRCPYGIIYRIVKYIKKGYMVAYDTWGEVYRQWESFSDEDKSRYLEAFKYADTDAQFKAVLYNLLD